MRPRRAATPASSWLTGPRRFRSIGASYDPSRAEDWAAVDVTEVGAPNGLLAEHDRLLLGGCARRGPDGRERPGRVSTLDYADHTLGRLGDQAIDSPDGIEPDGRGGYTVTDWGSGDLWHVRPDETWTRILTLPRGAADHHYLVDQRLLVVPLVLDHTVRAYRWAPAGDARCPGDAATARSRPAGGRPRRPLSYARGQ